MLVSEAVGRALVSEGVRFVFGLLGSGNLAVTNSLRDAGATFVAARHETGAVCMADGYSRVSGEVCCASVHQGPGLTNAITGLTEAAKSRTPIVVVAPDTPAAALRSNFKIDQDALVESVGAVAERVHGAETAVADAVRAVRRARLERRAVVLMLPLDVQAMEARGHGAPEAPELAPTRPDDAAVARAAALLADARRPAIVAGRGAVVADAGPALRRLGELSGAVLATSAVANGLFAGDPYDLGISGGFATPTAARLLQDADVVLAVGASLNAWTTRHGTLFAPDATVVQVDVDAEAIGAHRNVDLGLVGDARFTAEALVAALDASAPCKPRSGHARSATSDSASDDARAAAPDAAHSDPAAPLEPLAEVDPTHAIAAAARALTAQVTLPSGRSDELAEQIAAGRWRDEPYDEGDVLDPRTLSIALDDLLPAERTVAVDSGHFMGWPSMYLRVPDADGFVFPQAFQCVGLALGDAIGAAYARPDRLTVAALGDGGALLSLPEFETLGRLGLPILTVIYNDAAYGAEVHHFRPMGHAVDLAQFPDTDFAALARAAGCEGITVRDVADLEPLRAWLERRDRPMVVDAKVDPDLCADWLEEAFRGH
jgi:thiamine pyrophosphate-dependent acetolactate synthase large subunit-like protein